MDSPLLGEWQETGVSPADAESLTFRDDGTVKVRLRKDDLVGTYSYPGPNRLRIDLVGLKDITPPMMFRFSLSGRELTLDDSRGHVSTYERVDVRPAPSAKID